MLCSGSPGWTYKSEEDLHGCEEDERQSRPIMVDYDLNGDLPEASAQHHRDQEECAANKDGVQEVCRPFGRRWSTTLFLTKLDNRDVGSLLALLVLRFAHHFIVPVHVHHLVLDVLGPGEKLVRICM